MPKSLLLFICGFFNFHLLSAQFAEADFEHYTVLNGLSNNNVNTIGKDDPGYLWLGTGMGLNCFNGGEFKHYFSRGKPLNLAGTLIVKIIPFSNTRIGVISREGLQVINVKNLSTENYRFPDTSSFATYKNGVMDAVELPDKSVSLSSATIIYSFDKTGDIDFRYDSYTHTDVDRKTIIYRQNIVMLNDKGVLIYIRGNGLDHYDFRNKTLYQLLYTNLSRMRKPKKYNLPLNNAKIFL